MVDHQAYMVCAICGLRVRAVTRERPQAILLPVCHSTSGHHWMLDPITVRPVSEAHLKPGLPPRPAFVVASAAVGCVTTDPTTVSAATLRDLEAACAAVEEMP